MWCVGFDSVQGYQSGTAYFGATIGRFGNRLADGAFELDGKRYQVPLNDGSNSLHGGPQGFDKRRLESSTEQRQRFGRRDPDVSVGRR